MFRSDEFTIEKEIVQIKYLISQLAVPILERRTTKPQKV